MPAAGRSLARSFTPPDSGSRNGLPAARARHLDAQLVLADVRTVLRDDLAFVEDQGPVGQRNDLVQLERDEQLPRAVVPRLDEPPVDELDRTNVEPARRLSGDQDAGLATDLAREHNLLLVASRERRGARLRPSAADVELRQ